MYRARSGTQGLKYLQPAGEQQKVIRLDSVPHCLLLSLRWSYLEILETDLR